MRQARNAASACSRSSALLNLRRGCFEGWTSIGVAPLTSSTPCRRMRLRPARRDQFTRPAITHFLATRAIQQSRRETMREDRRLCLSAPNDHLQDKSSGPSNEPEGNARYALRPRTLSRRGRPRSERAIITSAPHRTLIPIKVPFAIWCCRRPGERRMRAARSRELPFLSPTPSRRQRSGT